MVREQMLKGHENDPDYIQQRNKLWWDVVTYDFNEFDAYLPFRSEPARGLRPQIQMAEDKYQRIPAGRTAGPKAFTTIKVYGDVAIVAGATVRKGDLVAGGGEGRVERKNTMVWHKVDGQWRLAFCNCEWRGSPDGIGHLPRPAVPAP